LNQPDFRSWPPLPKPVPPHRSRRRKPASNGFLEYLIERAHPLGRFHEQSYGFPKPLDGILFGAAARGTVQLQGLRNPRASFFESAGCHLEFHRLR